MSKVNQVMLIGYVGGNGKSIAMQNGELLYTVSLATHENVKKENGEKEQKTDWHNIVAFGKTASVFTNYVKQGSFVKIDGHLKTRQYVDKSENNRFVTEIVVDSVLILDRVQKS